MPFVVGETIGPYRILERLGQGGMATVFKAYHPALDRFVAIKALHPVFTQEPNFLARFQREARVVARLEHPNIVPVYDFADHAGHPYLVMKYIEGETLKARLSRGSLRGKETRRIVQEMGAALDFAHRQGILHRDIKPSNVLLAVDGQIYLADFGLARIAQAGQTTMSSDVMLGTPQYISPEQAMGLSELTVATDVYSFGVMLFEMEVGRVPFNADTPFSIIHDHIYTPLPMPRAVNPEVSEGVERVLLKALAKEPLDRYPGILALVEAYLQAGQVVEEQGVDPAATGVDEQPGGEGGVQPAIPAPTAGEFLSGQSDEAAQAPMAGAPAIDEGAPISTEDAPDQSEGAAVFGGTWPVTGGVAPAPAAGAEMVSEGNLVDTPEKPTRRRFRWWYLAPILGLACLCGVLLLVAMSDEGGTLAERRASLLTEEASVARPTEAPPDPPGSGDARDPVSVALARVEQNPQDPTAHLELAVAYWQAGQYEQALTEVGRLPEIAGEDPDFYVSAGDRLFDRELWLLAAGVYLKAFDLSDGKLAPEARDRLELSIYLAAESPEARRILVGHDRLPGVDPLLQGVAQARYQLYQDNIQAAQNQLAGVQKLEQDYPPATLLQAEILWATGNLDGAVSILEEIIRSQAAPEWVSLLAGYYLEAIREQ